MSILAATPAARAQTAEARAAAQKKAAEGARMSEQGRPSEALRLFREAYELHQNPGYLYNMGIAHQALGEDVEALAMFERFLDDARKVAPEFIADAVAQSREIKRRVAVVEVRCTQQGAQVSLDGKVLGRTPLRAVHARGGAHQIAVTKPGFVPFEQAFNLQPGGQLVIEALMRPLPADRSALEMGPSQRLPPPTESVAAAPQSRGGLDLDALVGLHVWMAGVNPSPEPSLALRLSAGWVPEALDGGLVALRLGATAGFSFFSEPSGKVYFTSLLATPGVRASFTPRLYGAFDLGLGVLITSGVASGSVLIVPGSMGVTGALSSFELRPSLALGYALNRSLALFAGAALVWDSKPDPLFVEGALMRFETGAGVRWKL